MQYIKSIFRKIVGYIETHESLKTWSNKEIQVTMKAQPKYVH